MNATARDLPAPTSVPTLRASLGGQNGPATAQITYLLIHALPRELARHPGSAAFRTIAGDYLAAWDIPLSPSRSDVREGCQFLARRGLLPPWVSFGVEASPGRD